MGISVGKLQISRVITVTWQPKHPQSFAKAFFSTWKRDGGSVCVISEIDVKRRKW